MATNAFPVVAVLFHAAQTLPTVQTDSLRVYKKINLERKRSSAQSGTFFTPSKVSASRAPINAQFQKRRTNFADTRNARIQTEAVPRLQQRRSEVGAAELRPQIPAAARTVTTGRETRRGALKVTRGGDGLSGRVGGRGQRGRAQLSQMWMRALVVAPLPLPGRPDR